VSVLLMQRLVAWEALRVQQPAVVDAAHVSRHWDKDKLVLALCERGVVDPYLQHLQKAELRALFLRSSTRDGELSAEMGVAVGEAAASLLARRLTVPVVGESPDAAALRHSAQVQRDHLQRPLEQLSPEARAALQARWSADVAKRRLALYRARQQGEAAAGVCAAQVHEEHRIGELLAEHRRGLRRVLCGPRVEQPVGRRAADICSGAVQVLPLVSAAVHMHARNIIIILLLLLVSVVLSVVLTVACAWQVEYYNCMEHDGLGGAAGDGVVGADGAAAAAVPSPLGQASAGRGGGVDSGTGAVPVPVVAVPPLLGQAGEDASAATAAVPSPLGQERASREAAGGVDGSVGAVPAFCPVDELIWWYSERDGAVVGPGAVAGARGLERWPGSVGVAATTAVDAHE
jgi:hypothetical protein